MSCGNHHDVPCIEIRPLIVLFIDNEISDAHQADIIEIHFGECPPCKVEMERESQSLLLMRDLLTRCCNEPAPASLHERLIEQTQQLHQEMTMRTEITYTESTYTEITVDGQTQIEITSKIRREFPRE
jgi:anti-sigma factor (TIGR02949 family)